MSYDYKVIESKWQEYWKKSQTFKAQNPSPSLPKKEPFYVLDMFPYPSGAGLHVGHPLGYIASDILARYKRHQGFNVLHPMGYDSFGLPAEQYAIQTGQHPAVTTETNINRYREQLDKIGFSFDWSREVRTSNPDYYKWTQWIFIQLFNSWYDKQQDKARSIAELIEIFEREGNVEITSACDEDTKPFSAQEWNSFPNDIKDEILLKYRIAYLAETEVNWCPELGTVLANDEVINGLSERGGYPVVRKKMKQWSMRITAYAERLLQDLEGLDWTDSLKETQRNWIGKSIGAQLTFRILSEEEAKIRIAHKNPTAEAANFRITNKTSENEHLFDKARENRDHPTNAQEILWRHLQNENFRCKFYRQQVIDQFIANFISYSKKLIIEVDREIYEVSDEYFEKRTEILNEKGFQVVHFDHEEVVNNTPYVLEKLNTILDNIKSKEIEVFTTRPDTIFGVSYLTLAPEHHHIEKIATETQQEVVKSYIEETAKRTDRERQAEGEKSISGVFTGAYAEHPLTKEPVPIWLGDYVLPGYGTGAVMAVPAGDKRDYKFASHFAGKKGMPPIRHIFEIKDPELCDEKYIDKKTGFVYKNSQFLDGLSYKDAFKKAIEKIEKIQCGKKMIIYRLRDAVFSRQRYWGEPFPIYYKHGYPKAIALKHLPLKLPEVEKYLPTKEGQPPLGRAEKWYWNENNHTVVSLEPNTELPKDIYPLELNTMPGWAGSSWYFFRYMEEAKRKEVFASKEALDYWKNVDLYIGGSEHATGHLLYARFWTKFLSDRGFVSVNEPFKKLINQGMILGESAFVYRLDFDYKLKDVSTFNKFKLTKERKDYIFYKLNNPKIFLSKPLIKTLNESGISGIASLDKIVKERIQHIKEKLNEHSVEINIEVTAKVTPIHVNVAFVGNSNILNQEAFKNWRTEFEDAEFITQTENKYIVGREVEKMSKSKYNVVNPDDICNEYGADALRLYEMFLGPIDQSKPWITAGLSGVYGFLKKLWNLYHETENSDSEQQKFSVTNQPAFKEALKILHKTIQKVTEDTEGFNFNTAISSLMICVNELSSLKCTSREVLEPLAILVSPYTPHIAEELWVLLGHQGGISTVEYPVFEEKYTKESSKTYPISFNGKTRFTKDLPLDLSKEEIKKEVMTDERTQKRLDGREPKKIIIVPGKIVNIVG